MVDEDFLLSLFAKKKALARRAYARFVRSRIREGHKKEFYKVKEQRFLGDEGFIEEIAKFVKERVTKKRHIALGKIVSTVGLYFDIPRELFFVHTRNRKAALGRSVVGYLAKKLCNYENRSIAQFFKRDPSVLGKGIRNVENQMIADRTFQKKLAAIENALIEEKE